MKTPFCTALLAAAFAMPALAQPKTDAAASGPSATAPMTKAEVRKVDKAAKKITLKHGEITNLQMPPMTMVFQVDDAALLDKVKAGDAVRFSATKNAGGSIVVTDIQPDR